jgi:hypothetical protein
VIFLGKTSSIVFAHKNDMSINTELLKTMDKFKQESKNNEFYSWWYPDVYRDAKNYVVSEVWNNGFWLVDEYISGNHSFDVYAVFENIYRTRSTMDYFNGYLWGYYYWDMLYSEYNRLYYIIRDSFLGSWYWDFNGNYFYNLQCDFCYGYLW